MPAKESTILLRCVQAPQHRQRLIERGSKDPRSLVHVGKGEPP
jgi:hypothetical protein